MQALKSEHKSKPAESKLQLCSIQYSTEESEGQDKIEVIHQKTVV